MAIAKAGLPVVPGIAVGVLTGAVVGLVRGLLITQAGLPPFIATLGMPGVARGRTFIVGGGNAVYGLPGGFRTFGEGQIGPIPLPLLYVAVIAGAGYVILSRTKLGRYAYAIGSDKEAARLSAISLNRYLTSVYVICSALAGFGGMIAASLVQSGQPNYGLRLELNVIAACVIGGTSLFGGIGTIGRTLIGAFLMADHQWGSPDEHHPVLPTGDHRGDHLAGCVVRPGPAAAAGGDNVARREKEQSMQDGQRDGDGQDGRQSAARSCDSARTQWRSWITGEAAAIRASEGALDAT